jgi:hypothetical protein
MSLKLLVCHQTFTVLTPILHALQKSALLFYEDRVFLYGKPSRINRAVLSCKSNAWR